jgi:hypothetical protein
MEGKRSIISFTLLPPSTYGSASQTKFGHFFTVFWQIFSPSSKAKADHTGVDHWRSYRSIVPSRKGFTKPIMRVYVYM